MLNNYYRAVLLTGASVIGVEKNLVARYFVRTHSYLSNHVSGRRIQWDWFFFPREEAKRFAINSKKQLLWMTGTRPVDAAYLDINIQMFWKDHVRDIRKAYTCEKPTSKLPTAYPGM